MSSPVPSSTLDSFHSTSFTENFDLAKHDQWLCKYLDSKDGPLPLREYVKLAVDRHCPHLSANWTGR